MTRRLQSCISCGGRTRHADRRCARCRRRRVSVRFLRDSPRDLRAPTVAELDAGIELSGSITKIELLNGPEMERRRMRWAREVQDVELAQVLDFRGRGA